MADRTMPAEVRERMIVLQQKEYLPVAARILWFRLEHPDWRIETRITEGSMEAAYAVVEAVVYDGGGLPLINAHKCETEKDFKLGFIEKAETGAVGRALGMLGYGTQFAGEELDERIVDAPQARRGAPANVDPETGEIKEPAKATAAATKGRFARAIASRAPKPQTDGDKPRTWDGPGQCEVCHCPAGKPHATNCTRA